MKKMISIVSLLSISLSTLASDKTALSVNEGLRKIGLEGISGILFSGRNCTASYQVDPSGQGLKLFIKSVSPSGQVTESQESIGPELRYFKTGSRSEASADLGVLTQFDTDYASDQNVKADLIFSSLTEEVMAVNIYTAAQAQCVRYSDPGLKVGRVILVNLTSKGGLFDSKAEMDFYTTVGAKISDQTLEQMMVLGYGDEGGKSYCLEINRKYGGKKLARTITDLQNDLKASVKPNSGTEFSLSVAQSCKQ